MKSKINLFINVDWFFLSHRKIIPDNIFDFDFKIFTDISDKNLVESYNNDARCKITQAPYKRSTSFFVMLFEFFKTFFLILLRPNDITHAVTIKPILLCGISCRILNRSFIGSISGLGPGFKRGESLLGKIKFNIIVFCYRIIFSGSRSIVIVQTEHDKKVLLKNNISSDNNIKLIAGSGVDIDLFKPRSFPSNKNFFHIFFASRLLKDKGIFEFFEIASHFTNDDFVKFSFAGSIDPSSPSSLTLQDLEKLLLQSNVKYLGHVDSLHNILNDIDLFVYPSYYPEGIPKILLECSSSGIPVLTNDHPGCNDAVINGVTGFVVENNDITKYINLIHRFIDDNDLYNSISLNARNLAIDRYDERIIINSHRDIYLNVLNNL